MSHTDSSSATPATIHLAGGCLVRRWRVHTYVGPRCLVRYTGHSKVFLRSCSSAGTALTYSTGMAGVRSLKTASEMTPVWVSQRAPKRTTGHAVLQNTVKNLSNLRMYWKIVRLMNSDLPWRVREYRPPPVVDVQSRPSSSSLCPQSESSCPGATDSCVQYSAAQLGKETVCASIFLVLLVHVI